MLHSQGMASFRTGISLKLASPHFLAERLPVYRLYVRRLRRWLRPGRSTLARNIWNLYLEIAYFGFMFGILQTFLNVYAIRLGASNTVLGFISAMPSLVFALGAIPAAQFVERADSECAWSSSQAACIAAAWQRSGCCLSCAAPAALKRSSLW